MQQNPNQLGIVALEASRRDALDAATRNSNNKARKGKKRSKEAESEGDGEKRGRMKRPVGGGSYQKKLAV